MNLILIFYIYQYRSITVKDVASERLDKYAEDLSALFININWKIIGNPNGKVIEDLVHLFQYFETILKYFIYYRKT